MKSVLEMPKMSFEDFKTWFFNEPIWHRIQIENVTVRDSGKPVKPYGGNKAELPDIYKIWYLPRLINS